MAADEGQTDQQISQTLSVGTATVYRTKRAFVEQGLVPALQEAPRPGAARKLSGKEELLLCAVACSDPPSGRARWTLELLAGEMVRLTAHEHLGKETVRRRLHDKQIKPWLHKMWCIPKVDADFVARMEDVVELYTQPDDEKHPVVCFDESPAQLLAETRTPVPTEPRKPARIDHEYKRNGTANLLVTVDAHRSWRHVKVTERRTCVDFAHCMQELVDVHYPEAEKIRVVLDNLSTHTLGALYQAFAPEEAHRILRRLEFHYVPKHASWLNLVEIDIGVLVTQCLDRRIGDLETLRRETRAWNERRNASGARIRWLFDLERARHKLGKSYPQPAPALRLRFAWRPDSIHQNHWGEVLAAAGSLPRARGSPFPARPRCAQILSPPRRLRALLQPRGRFWYLFPALLDLAISPAPAAPIPIRTECLGDNTLVDLVEGRLAFGDEREVEEHLDTCPACREFLADLVRASGTPVSPRGAVLPPGTRVGRYVLAERLGMGGMGLVYAAEDPELSRRVAIKVVRGGGDPERLREEARAMARLQSPHAVAVYDVGDLGGQLFVAMELVHGETLRTWTAGRSWREIVEAYRCAGRGLAAAHAAGLVHGDFKPDNVLIRARDGQVLVADFGLAHSGDGGPGSGTPAYMAPEQHAGRRGNARADQFAFCVSLWEALFGQRPFVGRTAAALSEAVLAGSVLAPPRGRAPRWVRRLLERGLCTDSEARHPSMEALVAALGRTPRRTAARIGVLVLLLLSGLGTALALMKRDTSCRPTGRELAGVWDGERRASVRRSLLMTGAPFAATTADAVERSLDKWSARWLAARVESCAATRVRGEQSLELLDRRMRCLDDRRAELAALSSWLSRADGETAKRALTAAEELGDVVRCEPRVLGEQRPTARRAPAEAAAARLRTAAAQAAAGRWAAALPEAQAVTAIARELADRALLAEATLVLGRARSKAGDAAGAAQALDESAAAAVAEHMDLVAAEAWTELVFVLGHRAADRERAETAGRYAAAAIERAGGDLRLRARLERQLGVAAAIAGQPRQAEQRFREALRVRESGGGEALELAGLHNDLGAALHTQGRLAEALAEHRQALMVGERVLGPAHPRLTPTLVNLGNVLNDLNRPREAEPLYRRALSLEERNGQEDSVAAAGAMANLALCLSGPAGGAEAEALLRRALSINEQRLGPNNAQVSAVAVNLASQLQTRGRHTEAEGLFLRALSIDEQRLGSDHAALAPAQNGLARALLAKGRPREALPLFERALRARQAELGPEDQRLAYSYEGMGEALLALGDRRKAVVMLERALGLLERGGGDPSAIAETRSRLQHARTRTR